MHIYLWEARNASFLQLLQILLLILSYSEEKNTFYYRPYFTSRDLQRSTTDTSIDDVIFIATNHLLQPIIGYHCDLPSKTSRHRPTHVTPRSFYLWEPTHLQTMCFRCFTENLYFVKMTNIDSSASSPR
jgi:hypothetical protein